MMKEKRGSLSEQTPPKRMAKIILLALLTALLACIASGGGFVRDIIAVLT